MEGKAKRSTAIAFQPPFDYPTMALTTRISSSPEFASMRKEAISLTFCIGITLQLSAEPPRWTNSAILCRKGPFSASEPCAYRPSSDSYNFAVSSDGRTFATGEHGEPWKIRLWDSTTGKEVWRSQLPDDIMRCDRLVFSPDGKRLMVIGCRRDDPDSNKIHHPLFLFDASTGKICGELSPKRSYGIDRWRFLLGGKYFLTEQEIEREAEGGNAPPIHTAA